MAWLERIALVLLLGGAASCLPEFTNEIPGGGGGTTSNGSGGGDGGTAGQSATGGGGAGGQGGSEPPCHPPDLVDNFNDASIDTTLWGLHGATDIISEHDGSLHFTPLALQTDDQWAGLVTQSSYNVTACSVWVQVPSLIHNSPDGFSYFELYSGGSQASFNVHDGWLTLSIAGDEPPIEMSYDPIQHLWWRFREEGGTLYLETAPDDLSWTVGHSAPTPATNVEVGLGRVTALLSESPGETTFDNLNALP